jgi:hypothetical protein
MAGEQELFAAIADRLSTEGVPEQAQGIEEFLQELGVAAPEGAVAGDSPIIAALQSLGGGISGLFGGEEEAVAEEPEFREAFGGEDAIRQMVEAQVDAALAEEISSLIKLSETAAGSQERIRAQGIKRGKKTAAPEDVFVSQKDSKGRDIIGRGTAEGGVERFEQTRGRFTSLNPPISVPQPLADLSIEDLAVVEIDENSSKRRREAAGKLRESKIEVRKIESEEEQRAAQIESRELSNKASRRAIAEADLEASKRDRDVPGMIAALREIEELRLGPSRTSRIPTEKQIREEKPQLELPKDLFETLTATGLASLFTEQFPSLGSESERGLFGIRRRRPFLEQLSRRVGGGEEPVSDEELRSILGIPQIPKR